MFDGYDEFCFSDCFWSPRVLQGGSDCRGVSEPLMASSAGQPKAEGRLVLTRVVSSGGGDPAPGAGPR